MGIKENFTQVKELTGIGKEQGASGSTPVEELKKAVEDDSASNPREITLDAGTPMDLDMSGLDDYDYDLDSMNSTVRPMSSAGGAQTTYKPQSSPQSESTPMADAFFSGDDVPVSLFGQQQAAQPVQSAQQAQSAQPVREAPPVQPMQSPSPFAQSPYSQAPVYYQQNNYYGAPPSQPPPSPQQPLVSPVATSRQHNRGNEENELTIISRNTMVDGNIRSFADMSIDGDIKGDVETTKDIDLNGKIIGNITCNNAMMHTSQVQGNVRMKGNISMKRDTLLMGDLMSTYAEVNGKVKGNLDVVGKADLKGDAVVFGDISASTITVEDGAIIQGYVSTTFLNKEESKNLFPDTVIIGDVGSARVS
jgi:cytoskeletal protein CcmA (bactofilin family)